jgi:hypothetical protein
MREHKFSKLSPESPEVPGGADPMVGVFSKLRAALFDTSRVRSYLIYATGEVILIVLGILIAIQLDSAQERRTEQGLERNYIENLIADVRLDIERSDSWFGRFDQKISGLLAAKDFYFDGGQPEDLQRFIATVGRGGVGSRGRLLMDAATFEELVSTGNLRYIRSDALKAEIIDFYTYKDFIDVYMTNLRSEYATYTNASRPYAPDGELVADPRDDAVALERFRQPEFLALINQELTFAYSINKVMDQHVRDAKALAGSLEAYLETF